MTTPQKVTLTFFFSSLLFGSVALLVYFEVFKLGEDHIYNPIVKQAIVNETLKDAMLLSGHLSGLQSQFSALLSMPAIQSGFNSNQVEANASELSSIFDIFLESIPALDSVYFIDLDKNSIYFSIDSISSNDGGSFSPEYWNSIKYLANSFITDIMPEKQARLFLDEEKQAMVFLFPLGDSSDHRRVAVFILSAKYLAEIFTTVERTEFDEHLALVVNSSGFVYGMPEIFVEEIFEKVSTIWKLEYKNIVPFSIAGVPFVLVSVQMEQGYYFGRIVNNADIFLSPLIKGLLLLGTFLVIFFLLMNVKRKPNEAVSGESAKHYQFIEEDENVTMNDRKYYYLTESVPSPDAIELFSCDDDISDDGINGFQPMKIVKKIDKTVSSYDGAELEYISGVGDLIDAPPFTVPAGNPQMLQDADVHRSAEVVIEQNGVPYINDDAIKHDKIAEEKIDGDFIKLVESVVGEPKIH